MKLHIYKPIFLSVMMGLSLISNSVLINAEEAGTLLPQVSVTATRTETDISDVPATVTVITREEMDRRIAPDDAALFENEPGISFSRDLRRFGATRINIRGVEDTRVIQMVDGVRLPDYYDTGGPSNFTLSGSLSVSQDFIKRIEVLRGPASSLYGSDAIGGVVGYVTLDPEDILSEGKDYGARYKLGFTGANDGLTNSMIGALRGDVLDVLVGYTQTNANEFDNKGHGNIIAVDRTKPNPQDIKDQGAIAKFILHPNETNQFSFIFEGRKQDADVTAKRLSDSLPKVTGVEGSDDNKRWRASAEWEHQPENFFYDKLVLNAFYQDAETSNGNIQTRTNTGATCSAVFGAGNNCIIDQKFKVSHETFGSGIQLESAVDLWGKQHSFTYGADVSRVETEEIRDASIHNLTTGTVTNSLAGDTFPVRDFPKGVTDTVGIFVQDEISGLADGALTIIPGLRYDWRKLTPKVDDLFEKTLTANDRKATKQKHARLSPKIGALYQLNSVWSVYGQAVTGFRAPDYDEVNGSFRNSIQQYAISPNNDLDPETSVGGEIGLKWHAPTIRGQLSIYDNHYKDFIDTVTLDCPTDPRCISGVFFTFINDNISKVRIYGAELSTAWNFAPNWTLDGSIAYAHGDNKTDDQPLNSVDPMRVSVGITRDVGKWGAGAQYRGASSVSRVDESAGERFRPKGYSVVDLSAWWRVTDDARFNVAVNNLFDKKYFIWSDLRQADSFDPAGVDFYSQPGRNISASFTYQF